MITLISDHLRTTMLTQWLNEAKLDLFGSAMVRNATTELNAVLCYQVDSSDLFIWLIDSNHISHVRFSEQSLKEECRNLKVTPVELLKALRESVSSKSATFTKSPTSVVVSFSSSQTGRIPLELSPKEPKADLVRDLLLAFGRSYSDVKQELDSAKSTMEESAARVFTQSAMLDTEHRAPKKKAKTEPGMSVVNPRSRIVKPARGVVYSDEEEED
ncbi:uncharacterized protein LOC129580949 [Paramacrobiotus metropolitanus]|uniref:uncharacterized protein LOC129580949 n=1 Tax=Paramacrobiotus metropolitanus TaxID=2943436 RepID=UPI002446518C|nr:uncharacterized protein LOC129580949 [Paramacrobiotus metropolitanus]